MWVNTKNNDKVRMLSMGAKTADDGTQLVEYVPYHRYPNHTDDDVVTVPSHEFNRDFREGSGQEIDEAEAAKGSGDTVWEAAKDVGGKGKDKAGS